MKFTIEYAANLRRWVIRQGRRTSVLLDGPALLMQIARAVCGLTLDCEWLDKTKEAVNGD